MKSQKLYRRNQIILQFMVFPDFLVRISACGITTLVGHGYVISKVSFRGGTVFSRSTFVLIMQHYNKILYFIALPGLIWSRSDEKAYMILRSWIFRQYDCDHAFVHWEAS